MFQQHGLLIYYSFTTVTITTKEGFGLCLNSIKSINYKLIFQATNTKLGDHTFLFQGAGEASIGIANLIAMAMEKREGIPFEEGLKKIWLKDSKGLIVANRSSGGITHHKVKNILFFLFNECCRENCV